MTSPDRAWCTHLVTVRGKTPFGSLVPVASTTPVSVATHLPRKSSGIAIIGSSALPNGVATDDDDDDDDDEDDDDDDADDANGTAAADVSVRREAGPAAAAPSPRPCCMVQKIVHLPLFPHLLTTYLH